MVQARHMSDNSVLSVGRNLDVAGMGYSRGCDEWIGFGAV